MTRDRVSCRAEFGHGVIESAADDHEPAAIFEQRQARPLRWRRRAESMRPRRLRRSAGPLHFERGRVAPWERGRRIVYAQIWIARLIAK